MKTSEKGKALIKSFESLQLNAYLDQVGVPTIGYGHTKNVKVGQAITEDQADKLLSEDLQIFEKAVNDYVKVSINQNQFDALVCFAFNVGTFNFKGSRLLRCLNDKDYKLASEQFKHWNKITIDGVKQISSGLSRRRAAEEKLFNEA